MRQTVNYYKENALIIKNCMEELKIENYGGINSPYIWAKFPEKKSWDILTNFWKNAML